MCKETKLRVRLQSLIIFVWSSEGNVQVKQKEIKTGTKLCNSRNYSEIRQQLEDTAYLGRCVLSI